MAASAREGARRQAATPCPAVAREADRGQGRGDDGRRVPRRLEREGQTGARLDAPLPELAPGLHRGLRSARHGRGHGVTRQDRTRHATASRGILDADVVRAVLATAGSGPPGDWRGPARANQMVMMSFPWAWPSASWRMAAGASLS